MKIVNCIVMDGNWTCDDLVVYTKVKLLCCTPGTNITASIKI